MKVVALGLRGIPDVMGGVETHCEQLYPRIRVLAPDIDITVLARSPYVSGGVRDFQGVKVRPIPAITNAYLEAIVHTFLGVLYARFSERADIVHVHAIGPGLMIPLAKLLGLSVVFTHHGEDYRRDKWNGIARTALRLGEYVAARFSDAVITVSRPVARSLAARHRRLSKSIVTIPNGATVDSSSPDASPDDVLARFGLQAGQYVMAVARLVPEKGIHDLIDAASGLPDGFKLVIVGGAQVETPYSRQLKARASDRVVFTGALPRAEIAPLYGHTALFVLPSYHEGLPIAALEAMSVGARVLLSDIEPNKDIGLSPSNYFPARHVAELSRRLSTLDTIPLSDAGQLLSRYDWNVIAAETAGVFRSVLGRGTSAGTDMMAVSEPKL